VFLFSIAFAAERRAAQRKAAWSAVRRLSLSIVHLGRFMARWAMRTIGLEFLTIYHDVGDDRVVGWCANWCGSAHATSSIADLISSRAASRVLVGDGLNHRRSGLIGIQSIARCRQPVMSWIPRDLNRAVGGVGLMVLVLFGTRNGCMERHHELCSPLRWRLW
jgi:hypothetical protein